MQAASLAAANRFALAWGAGGCSCPTPRRSKELGVGLTTLVFRFCQWLNPDCLEYRGGLAVGHRQIRKVNGVHASGASGSTFLTMDGP